MQSDLGALWTAPSRAFNHWDCTGNKTEELCWMVTFECYSYMKLHVTIPGSSIFNKLKNMFYRPAARWRRSCVSARIPAAWIRGLGAMPKRRSWWTGASHLAGEPGWNGGFTQKMEARHAFTIFYPCFSHALQCFMMFYVFDQHCVLHSFVDTCEMFTDCVPMFCQHEEKPGCHGRLEATWEHGNDINMGNVTIGWCFMMCFITVNGVQFCHQS